MSGIQRSAKGMHKCCCCSAGICLLIHFLKARISKLNAFQVQAGSTSEWSRPGDSYTFTHPSLSNTRQGQARPSLETPSETLVTPPVGTCLNLRRPAHPLPGPMPTPALSSKQHNPVLKFNFSLTHSIHNKLRKACEIQSCIVAKLLAKLRCRDPPGLGHGLRCHDNELPWSLRYGNGSRMSQWVMKRSPQPR